METAKPKKKKFSFTAKQPTNKPPPPSSSVDEAVQKSPRTTTSPSRCAVETPPTTTIEEADSFQTRLERVLARSLLDQSGHQLDHGYALTDVRTAATEAADESRLLEKRRELKGKWTSERFLFYLTESEARAAEILSTGLKCVGDEADLETNLIGNSRHGLTLVKHLDVALLNEYRKRTRKFYCVVVKALLSSSFECACLSRKRCSEVKEAAWTPSRRFDWTTSRTTPHTSQPIKRRFANSLVYIYDYKLTDAAESLPLEAPRSLVPFAVLTYELASPADFDPALLKLHSNRSAAPSTCTLDQYRESTKGAKILSATQYLLTRRRPVCLRLNSHFQGSEQATVAEASDYPGREADDYFVDEDEASGANENVPRWRIVAELGDSTTPAKFAGKKSMQVRLNDLRAIKNFKYMDGARTRMNVNDSTNKLIFLYQSKRFPTKKTIAKSSASSQSIVKNPAAATTGKKPSGDGSQPTAKPNEAGKMQRVKISVGGECLVDRQEPKSGAASATASNAAGVAKPTSKVAKTGAPTVKAASIPTAKPLTPLASKTQPLKPAKTAETGKEKSAVAAGVVDAAASKAGKELGKAITPATGSLAKDGKNPADVVSLSSELTSLEKRLLRLDKAKASTLPTAAKTSQPPASKTDKPAQKPANEKPEPPTSGPTKRRKSFWDRESPHEDAGSPSGANDPHSSDSDYDDVVVVTKRNLNMPPIQYSKQYYDLNISGLECELKRFDFSANSSLSPSLKHSLNNPSTITTTTVTKIASKAGKATAQSPAALQKQEQQLKRAQRAGLLVANRQRFMHHIVTSLAGSPAYGGAGEASHIGGVHFDVDNLKYLYDTSILYSNQASSNDEEEVPCFEINAGGFRCIHQFRHKRAALLHNFRRTQSYGSSLSGGASLSVDAGLYHSHSTTSLVGMDAAGAANANKRISLNDYVSLRARQHSFPAQQQQQQLNASTSSIDLKSEEAGGDRSLAEERKTLLNLENVVVGVKRQDDESSHASSNLSDSRHAFNNNNSSIKSEPIDRRADTDFSSLRRHIKSRVGEDESAASSETANLDDYNSNYDQIEQDTMNELIMASTQIKREMSECIDRSADAADKENDAGSVAAVAAARRGKSSSSGKKRAPAFDPNDTANQSYDTEFDATLTPDESRDVKSERKKKKRKSREKQHRKGKKKRRDSSSSSSLSSSLSLSPGLLSSSSSAHGKSKRAREEGEETASEDGLSSHSSSGLHSSSSLSLSLSDDDDDDGGEDERRKRSKKSRRHRETKSSRRRSKEEKKLKKRKKSNEETANTSAAASHKSAVSKHDPSSQQEEGELQDEDYDDFGDAQLEEELLFKKFKYEQTESNASESNAAHAELAATAASVESSNGALSSSMRSAEESAVKVARSPKVEPSSESNDNAVSETIDFKPVAHAHSGPPPLSHPNTSFVKNDRAFFSNSHQQPLLSTPPNIDSIPVSERPGLLAVPPPPLNLSQPPPPFTPLVPPPSLAQPPSYTANNSGNKGPYNRSNSYNKKPPQQANNPPFAVSSMPQIPMQNSPQIPMNLPQSRGNPPISTTPMGRNHMGKMKHETPKQKPGLDHLAMPGQSGFNSMVMTTPNMNGAGLLGAAPASLTPVVSPMVAISSTTPLSAKPKLPMPKFGEVFAKTIKDVVGNNASPGIGAPSMMKGPRNQQHQTPSPAFSNPGPRIGANFSNNGFQSGGKMGPSNFNNSINNMGGVGGGGGYSNSTPGMKPYPQQQQQRQVYEQDDYYGRSSGYYDSHGYYDYDQYPAGSTYDQGYGRHKNYNNNNNNNNYPSQSSNYYGNHFGNHNPNNHNNNNNNNNHGNNYYNNPARMNKRMRGGDEEDGEVMD